MGVDRMKRAMLIAAFMACFPMAVSFAMRRQPQGPEAAQGQFDYYVLALSWAPNYCARHPNDHSGECSAGHHANFVLHGLWPQASAGGPPTRCAPARPASRPVVRHMLDYYPSRGLIQHEWQQHGVCSGLSAGGYFDQVEQAFNAVTIPDRYRNLDHRGTFDVHEIEQTFAQANNAPPEAFRISCHAGEMVSLQVCLSKDLHYQPCTASVRECRSSKVLMRAVQ